MSEILYSIVIPVHNTERYLWECAASVKAQTLDNWELVLVDDGSTDSSPAICDKLARSFEGRVSVVHQENLGLLSARRVGLRASHGDVLLFLDSDDALRPDALERIDGAFRRYNPDMVLYGFSYKPDFSSMANPIFPKTSVYDRFDCARALCTSPLMNPMWTKAVRRGCIDIEADYSSYGRLCFAEDMLQALSIVDLCKSVFYLREPLYYYRANPASLTHVFNPSHVEDDETVLAQLRLFAAKWDEEFSDSSFIMWAATRSLNDYAMVIQNAVEGLDGQKASDVMARVASFEGFSDSLAIPGALEGLRPDRRFIVSSVNRGRYQRVGVLVAAKRLLRNVRNRHTFNGISHTSI